MAVQHNFSIRFPEEWSMEQIAECNGIAQLSEWNPSRMWDVNDKRLLSAELTEEQAMVLMLHDLEVERITPR